MSPETVLEECVRLRAEIETLKTMNLQLETALLRTSSLLVHYRELGLIPKLKGES